jgi:tetratricopeptide (TPR) repeat protein
MNLVGPLGADNEAALARLKRALIAQPGFQLILLETPEGPDRDRVLEIVMAWSGQDGVPKLRRIRARGRSEVVAKLASRHGGLLVDDLDTALLDDAAVDRLVGTMNWQRDQLRKRIAGPLILVVSGRGVARLFERAPDLATWRSHTCRITRFRGEGDLVQRIQEISDAREPDSVDLDRAEAVLSALQRRGGPPDAIAEALLRVGQARERCGDCAQARNAFRKAAKAATEKTEIRTWALISLGLLDAKEQRISDALAFVRELAPLVANSTDAAVHASASSLQAAIAMASNDVMAAVALYRDAAAVVADRPDLHSVALFGVAEALSVAGDLDQAVRTLERARAESKDPTLQVRTLDLEAEIEASRNRPDLSIARLQEAVALAGKEPTLIRLYLDMSVRLAARLLSIGRNAEVRRAVRQVREILKKSTVEQRAHVAFLDGAAATRLKRKSAISLLEQAVTLTRDPGQKALAKVMLAVARVNRRDVAGAKRAATSGLQLARASHRTDVLELAQPLHDALFLPRKKGASPSSKPLQRQPARPVARAAPKKRPPRVRTSRSSAARR